MTMLNVNQSSSHKQKNIRSSQRLLDTMNFKKLTSSLIVSTVFGLIAVPAQAAESETVPRSDLAEPQNSSIEAPTSMSTEATPTSVKAAPISAKESTNGLIALVDDTPILKSDLAVAIAATQARIQANGQATPSAQQLQNDVLNSLIMRELQLNMAKRAGIRPEPDAVNQGLARIAQSQGLSSLSELQQTLDAQQPGSYADLRSKVIEEESIKVLQQSQVANRVRITEQDVDAFLSSPEAQRLNKTEYRTIHIRVPFSDDYSRITDSEKERAMQIAQQAQRLLRTTDDAQSVLQDLAQGIAKDYIAPVQGGDMGYHEAAGLPTEIATQITPLNSGDVTEPQITPAGIDVVKLVDKRGNEDMIIPQWKVRHILVKTDELNSDALAEQKINDIYEQLRRDADFAAFAATYSDDPGSAGRGGDLGWVSEGQMVPEFEEMLKRTPKGDFSTPFKSQFGWHILKVEDMRQEDVTDTVKRNLAREALYQRLAPQAQEDWLQELRANAYIQIFN